MAAKSQSETRRPLPSSNVDVAPDHSPAAILAHSRFPAARAAYIEAILFTYRDPSTNRLITEVGRSVAFFNIVSLYACYDEADRKTWPTPSLLREEMLAYGMTGDRRVAELVTRLVDAGYVESQTIAEDRRIRLLVPTDKMIAHDLDWLTAHFAPLEAMFPDPGYALPMRRDLAYHKAHRRLGRRMTANAVRLMSDNSPMMFFLSRDAGPMILIELVRRQLDTGMPQQVSFTDISAALGISRTHLRKTLQDADRAGLVSLSGREVLLLPSILKGFDRFVADCMSSHDFMFKCVTGDATAPPLSDGHSKLGDRSKQR